MQTPSAVPYRRRFAQIGNDSSAGHRIAAVHAEGFAEGTDQHIGLRAATLFRAAARIAERADAVRIIDEKDHAFRVMAIMAVADRG